jgi:hypothetical protein
LGCFDYALVRDRAAQRFLTAGLLDPQEWGFENLSGPLPDIVVMVSRRWPTASQVHLGELLMGLGRRLDESQQLEQEVLQGLAHLSLDGFNPMLEAEFERTRRRYARCWPHGNL